MSTYRRQEGCVEITTDELSARCSHCKKAIIYQHQTKLDLWKEILRSFVKKHRNCGGTSWKT